MTRNTLIEKRSRHGAHCLPIIMSEEKSVNIDGYEDLKLAEFLIGWLAIIILTNIKR